MIQKNQINKSRTLPEIFERVAQLKSNKDKVALLRLYDNKTLRWFVNSLYNVDWSEMEVPQYKPSKRPPEISHQSIGTAIKRIDQAYFYRKTNPEITERNLILVLEEMSSAESELLVNMFNGRRKIEGVSKSVFKELYPNFFRIEEVSDNDQGKD